MSIGAHIAWAKSAWKAARPSGGAGGDSAGTGGPRGVVAAGAQRLGPDFEATDERYEVLFVDDAMCPEQVMTKDGARGADVAAWIAHPGVPAHKWATMRVLRRSSGVPEDAPAPLRVAIERGGAVALLRAPESVVRGAKVWINERAWTVSGAITPDTVYEEGCMNA